MSKSIVYVDPSWETHVYGCHSCEWWRGIALSREAAEDAAILHEEDIHGTNNRRRARDARLARQKDKFVPTP